MTEEEMIVTTRAIAEVQAGRWYKPELVGNKKYETLVYMVIAETIYAILVGAGVDHKLVGIIGDVVLRPIIESAMGSVGFTLDEEEKVEI